MKWLSLLFISMAASLVFFLPFSAKVSNDTLVIQESSNIETKVFKNEKNNYSIVVIADNLSAQEVEEKANETASQLATDKGFKSYHVISKEKVRVILGKTDWPNSYEFPQNLYEEVIVQRNYNYKRSIEQNMPDNSIHNAYLYQIELKE